MPAVHYGWPQVVEEEEELAKEEERVTMVRWKTQKKPDSKGPMRHAK